MPYWWGNDIVALNQHETDGSKRVNRWLNLVCSLKEQEYIRTSGAIHQARWRLWSCKESLYKVLIKCGVPAFLNARRIEIFPEGSLSQKEIAFRATFEGQQFYGHSFLREQWVYSICSNFPFKAGDYHSAIFQTFESTASQQIRTQIRMHLKNTYGVELKSITQTAANIPMATCTDTTIKIDLSFTHHAPYSAYLYQICF